MILLDALYINNSGGLRLLQYLVKSLTKEGAVFHLLADIRCLGLFDGVDVEYMSASLVSRKRYYINNRNAFTLVLCFGNIPPPITMDVPVYTYFHNINLLTLKEAKSLKIKLTSWLKRCVFKYYKKNTNYWLVQTLNTQNELVKNLHEELSRIKLMPFYELPNELKDLSDKINRNDYVFVSAYLEAKGHKELLDAWRILHNDGIDVVLHLTVDYIHTEYCNEIIKAQQEGVKIINHGKIPFSEVVKLYGQSKATIYPSHNESLGLGIIEALTAGCDVIGADLPYIYSICKPSCVFDPYSSTSIADAVKAYEKDTKTPSKLLISNKISEMVGLMLKNSKKMIL